MKRISEFIKEFEALKDKHGDLPVVVDFSDFRPTVNFEMDICFSAHGAIDHDTGTEVDCVIIT